MVHTLKLIFLAKKIDHLRKIGNCSEIMFRTAVVENKTLYRLINQGRKDMDMESCHPVSAPRSPSVTEKERADAEQVLSVLAGLYRRVTGRLLNSAGKELAQGIGSPTGSLQACHDLFGGRWCGQLEVCAVSK